jgi:hypothetical protein
MSQIVTTQFGRFRHVSLGDDKTAWLWECPKCEQWGGLSEAQWAGTVSVACDCGCYHETHNFGAELVVVMQARILTGNAPIDTEAMKGK